MQVVELKIDNIKRISAATIRPKEGESVVMVTGPNGAGKSTALDAIEMAVRGGRAFPGQPLRTGSNKGGISLDLGEIKINWRIVAGKPPRVEVTAKDGSRISSPQAVLDKLYEKIGFDPLEFSRMPPREQRATLMNLTGLDECFAKLDADKDSALGDRRDVERDCTAKAGQITGMPEPAANTPDALIDISDMQQRVEAASQNNDEHAALVRAAAAGKHSAESHEDRRDSLAAKCADLRNELEAHERALQIAAGAAKVERKSFDELSTNADAFKRLDIIAATRDLEAAHETNRAVEQKQALSVAQHDLANLQQRRTASADRLDTIESDRREALGKAEFPIPALGFTDDGVTLNDLPFEQASSAEQLRVSLSIAMALKPDLRVILIRDGSLLDDNSLSVIREMAADKDYQLWIEKVDTTGTIGVYIEDGAVVTAPTPEPAQVEVTGQ